MLSLTETLKDGICNFLRSSAPHQAIECLVIIKVAKDVFSEGVGDRLGNFAGVPEADKVVIEALLNLCV